jgi:alkylhydroperoxidase family enzyme
MQLGSDRFSGSNYCLSAHSVTGRNAGLTEAEIESARRAAASEAKADQMLRFTQSLVLQRGQISDADLAALRQAGFSDAEVIEIVANIAQNIFTNDLTILSKTKAD